MPITPQRRGDQWIILMSKNRLHTKVSTIYAYIMCMIIGVATYKFVGEV